MSAQAIKPKAMTKHTVAKPKAATGKSYVYKIMESPVGKLTLVGSDRGLAAVLWENDNPRRVRRNIVGEDRNHPILLQTEKQLTEYFAGKRKKFSLKLDFVGTEFQNKVWQALLAIPFGETRTYGGIARQLGNPKAVRAVGAANGKNPISIIAPCHRVIGSTGKLTGFAGGLDIKARLLELEGGSPKSGRRRTVRPFHADDTKSPRFL